MASMMVLGDPNQSDSAFGDKLVRFIENRLTYINTFQGFWRNRPENCNIGDRFGALVILTVLLTLTAIWLNGL